MLLARGHEHRETRRRIGHREPPRGEQRVQRTMIRRAGKGQARSRSSRSSRARNYRGHARISASAAYVNARGSRCICNLHPCEQLLDPRIEHHFRKERRELPYPEARRALRRCRHRSRIVSPPNDVRTDHEAPVSSGIHYLTWPSTGQANQILSCQNHESPPRKKEGPAPPVFSANGGEPTGETARIEPRRPPKFS